MIYFNVKNVNFTFLIIYKLIFYLQTFALVKKKIRLFLRILGEKEEEKHEIRQ